MDFFARQEIARRRTWWLVVMFIVALAGIIVSAYAACTAIIQYAFTHQEVAESGLFTTPPNVWNPELLIGIAAVVSFIVLGGTVFKLAQLRQGGVKVAEMLGGRRLDPASTQLDERRVLNVVEEMAIASGVPVPPVYVLPGQNGINAFAAGYSMNDAVVGITEGAMRGFNREELQGVIAHEFSHILNGDMRLNIRLIGVLHGLLILAIVGRVMLHMSGSGRSSSGKKGGAALVIVVLGLALIIIGYFGYFIGGLVKRAVSRQREYLADASAVQFTRNPTGLASALKKVGGLAQGGTVKHNHAEELSHMFFSDGIKRLFGAGSLFSTHPPLAERVKLLDPTFDGKFPIVTEDMLKVGRDAPESSKPSAQAAEKGREFIKKTMILGGTISVDPRTIMQQVGVLEAMDMETTGNLVADIPAALRAKTHEPIGAQSIVLALLIHNADQKSSADAWTWIPASFTDSVSQSLDAMTGMKPEHRLVLLDMAFPALRSLGREQAERFLQLLRQIIDSDQRVDMLEFVLYEIVQAGMRETLGQPVPAIKITSISPVHKECAVLLSKMAYIGSPHSEGASNAFEAAIKLLGDRSDSLTLMPKESLTADILTSALTRMRTTSMPVRKILLEAVLSCLMADKVATVEEQELFRAFAAVLEVPVPPQR